MDSCQAHTLVRGRVPLRNGSARRLESYVLGAAARLGRNGGSSEEGAACGTQDGVRKRQPRSAVAAKPQMIADPAGIGAAGR